MRAERARPAPAITSALREELVQRSVVPEPQLPLGKAPCAAGSHVPIPQWTLGNSSSANHWCKKKSATLAQVKLSFVSSAPNAPPFHWQKRESIPKAVKCQEPAPRMDPRPPLPLWPWDPTKQKAVMLDSLPVITVKGINLSFLTELGGLGRKEKKVQHRY